MSTDWIDDPSTSFEDKLAHAEQFNEVEVRGPRVSMPGAIVGVRANNSVGSVIVPAPKFGIDYGSNALRESIARTGKHQTA